MATLGLSLNDATKASTVSAAYRHALHSSSSRSSSNNNDGGVVGAIDELTSRLENFTTAGGGGSGGVAAVDTTSPFVETDTPTINRQRERSPSPGDHPFRRSASAPSSSSSNAPTGAKVTQQRSSKPKNEGRKQQHQSSSSKGTTRKWGLSDNSHSNNHAQGGNAKCELLQQQSSGEELKVKEIINAKINEDKKPSSTKGSSGGVAAAGSTAGVGGNIRGAKRPSTLRGAVDESQPVKRVRSTSTL